MVVCFLIVSKKDLHFKKKNPLGTRQPPASVLHQRDIGVGHFLPELPMKQEREGRLLHFGVRLDGLQSAVISSTLPAFRGH